MESPVSVSSLLCQESSITSLTEDELGEQEEVDNEDPFLATFGTSNGFADTEDEFVEMLMQMEKADSSLFPANLLHHTAKLARLDAIDYILRIKSRLGFQIETAYLAVTYLDRFLSLRTLDSEKAWASELLSLGCVSLAAKFQECNAVGFSSFQHGSFRFEVKSIQRMELLILSTLDWKMGSITPFSFLPYFINKLLCGPPPPRTLTKILQLILSMMKDISLMDHYPSAIASAAVLMTLDESLTRNALCSKINALSWCRFLDIDDVIICYLIMQKLEGKQTKITSPDLSPFNLQNWPASSSISSKRRRLSFSHNVDKDQALSKRHHDSDI